MTGYRKSVVKNNLINSFPDKSTSEIEQITKTAYKNIADIMVEGIKGASMKEKQIRRRYPFMNPELLDKAFEENKSVILVAGHFMNWEWAALSPPFFFKHHVVALYKRLHNKYLNDFMKRSRSHTGESLYELRETAKAFEKHTTTSRPSIFFLAADQSPSNTETAHWVEFLNQDTPCLHGPEKYARLYNLPVVFAYPKRIKRGYYEVYLEWITEDVGQCEQGEVTAAFMHRLEQVILADPGNWLWSHKRWKHSRK